MLYVKKMRRWEKLFRIDCMNKIFKVPISRLGISEKCYTSFKNFTFMNFFAVKVGPFVKGYLLFMTQHFDTQD